MTQRTYMLAAGGTGGHLFPAFALAEELLRRGASVDLVTDMRGDRFGADFPGRQLYRVPSATLGGRSPVALARTGLTLGRGVGAAYRLLGRVRPSLVVGFGGYPTFPPLVAARLRAIATIIHEQNAVLGRANRMLARRVSAIATSFETTRLLDHALASKVTLTGNPVRDAVIAASAEAYVPAQADDEVRIIIFGGSQGARYFSDAVPPALAALPADLKARLKIVQQCRKEDLERVQATYREAEIAAETATFFADLPARMAAAHLVIARAGATTVAELAVLGRPSILVPLPDALDNDQLQNAIQLAESGGSWCIEQSALTPERLSSEIAVLLADPERMSAAAQAARGQGRTDAVARLADLVEEHAR